MQIEVFDEAARLRPMPLRIHCVREPDFAVAVLDREHSQAQDCDDCGVECEQCRCLRGEG